jgi:hypothetical protein
MGSHDRRSILAVVAPTADQALASATATVVLIERLSNPQFRQTIDRLTEALAA